MAYKTYTLKPDRMPTARELKEIEEAASRAITFDDDCPELTAEQLSEFKRISEINRDERKKQTVTIRLSPQAMKKAKSLGKGYTSVLGRILEKALYDDELIKRNL